MSRWEFMRQLEELLSDISPSEKEEALQYYNDYFNDAGRENEQEVIKALGSPAQVAGIVRDGLNENVSSGEFTESGFKNGASSQQNPIIERAPLNAGKREAYGAAGERKDADAIKNEIPPGRYGNPGDGTGENKAGTYGTEDRNTGGSNREGTYTREVKNSFQKKIEGMPIWAIVLIIIGCIFLAPVILGGIGGLLGGLISLVAGAAAVVLGIGAAVFVLYFAAVLLVVAGIGCIFVAPIKGIGLIGAGCICGALGILCMLLTYFLAGKAIPGICRGIGYACKKAWDKIGGMKR